MEALSIPTWVIHISSVLEWMAAIVLIWRFGELHPQQGWKWLALAMLPALISAMCACTWHYYNNDVQLEWLVVVQAGLTLFGNTTLCLAAGWIYYRYQAKLP
ncbi:DUF2499 domain-containing protein [Thermosynechococcaceae cyanobacterium BACA0444]|uniref:DUF2499 domain-containing protein n=1 Tax=Pseudocalidococcus azoricus BACA0444 TaxID=2918990 RepID=A0AAE4FTV9_9CYAN|nr:DUF2499 domain-containing protein [Pseudocalidococcus azoricus]MDS3861487.1 DUF2499 domain-containing protein [Pseudocalidococcus azoricus BACA0444]